MANRIQWDSLSSPSLPILAITTRLLFQRQGAGQKNRKLFKNMKILAITRLLFRRWGAGQKKRKVFSPWVANFKVIDTFTSQKVTIEIWFQRIFEHLTSYVFQIKYKSYKIDKGKTTQIQTWSLGIVILMFLTILMLWLILMTILMLWLMLPTILMLWLMLPTIKMALKMEASWQFEGLLLPVLAADVESTSSTPRIQTN